MTSSLSFPPLGNNVHLSRVRSDSKHVGMICIIDHLISINDGSYARRDSLEEASRSWTRECVPEVRYRAEIPCAINGCANIAFSWVFRA